MSVEPLPIWLHFHGGIIQAGVGIWPGNGCVNMSLEASFDRAYKGTQSQKVVLEYGVRLPISGKTTSGSSHLCRLCTRIVSPESKRGEISPG